MAPLRPLEERFPTLYWDIVNVAPAYNKDTGEVGPPVEQRTPRPSPPTTFEVIQAVLTSHRNTDTDLMKDLTVCMETFFGLGSPVVVSTKAPEKPTK